MRPLLALFLRSLREDSRARFPIILRTALVLIILLIFFANRNSMRWSSAPGRELFLMIMMLNCGFIGITALSIFPTAIAEEKEDETLTLLRMTNLSALAILFGKSTSRLMVALLLLVVQVPFTLLCVTLGGISQEQVWMAYAILGATTFFLCNLALLASVFCKTTIRAGFLTGVLGTILYVGLPFVFFILLRQRIGIGSLPPGMGGAVTSWGEQLTAWMIQLNPIWALVSLLEIRSIGLPVHNQIWFSLGGGAFCFLFSWLIFDRYCTKSGDEFVGPRIKTRTGKVRRIARVPRPWFRWPLAWKDFHFMVGGRFGIYLRSALALISVGTVYAIVKWEAEERAARGYGYTRPDEYILSEICAICMVGAMMIVGLEILLLAGRIFGVERRRLTLSSLVGLPWKPGKIIRQKIFGCLPALLPWFTGAVVAFALFPKSLAAELINELRDTTWQSDKLEISVLIYVVLQTLLLLVTIVWFSLRIRRGALPSAIVVIGVWNFIFGLIVDEIRRNSFLAVLVGVWLTLPVLILMARAVYYRLQLVAAEE